MGGTLGMRAAKTEYLPMFSGEQDGDYQERIAKSFLLNAYADTITGLAARAFRKEASLGDGAPEVIQEIAADVDREGRTLSQFAHDLLLAAIGDGVAFILVDYPVVPEGLSRAAEQELGARAFFVMIHAGSLIAFRSRPGPSGQELTQVRFRERAMIPVDEWTDEEVEQVRVLTLIEPPAQPNKPTPDSYVESVTYRKNRDSEWVPTSPPQKLTIGYIPLVAFYTNRNAFMRATPALEDLAWLNVAHWQSYSDQRQLLGFAKRGILFGRGFSDKEIGAAPVIGNRLWRVTSPEADLKWVEHTGSAINAGRQDLLDLEERMVMLGLRPLLRKPGQQTATETMIETSESNSSLVSWMIRERQALEAAFRIAGEWHDLGDVKVAVRLPDDATLGVDIALRVESWFRMRERGDLPRKDFWKLLAEHDLLPTWFDPERAELQLEDEDPLSGDPPEPDPEPEA
jgi:hypothetical protein